MLRVRQRASRQDLADQMTVTSYRRRAHSPSASSRTWVVAVGRASQYAPGLTPRRASAPERAPVIDAICVGVTAEADGQGHRIGERVGMGQERGDRRRHRLGGEQAGSDELDDLVGPSASRTAPPPSRGWRRATGRSLGADIRREPDRVDGLADVMTQRRHDRHRLGGCTVDGGGMVVGHSRLRRANAAVSLGLPALHNAIGATRIAAPLLPRP